MLKQRLLEKGSDITVSGPRCSLRSGKMYSDAVPDYARMLIVNVPAALIVRRRFQCASSAFMTLGPSCRYSLSVKKIDQTDS